MLEHVRSIERRNRNQVEHGEHEIDRDAVEEHELNDRERDSDRRYCAAGKSDGHDERREHDREHEIRRDPRERNDDVSAPIVAVVARIDRHGLCAAERDAHREERDRGHDQRHDGIDMLERIPGEAALHERGVVALLECGVTMRVFMRHHRKEYDRGDEKEQLELVQ